MALASLLYPQLDAAGGGMEPLSSAALLSAGSNVLGKALQGGAGPSRAESASKTEAIFNNSGWVVNFGEGATVTAKSDSPLSQLPGIAGNMSTTGIVLLAAGALLLWSLSKKSR